MLFLQHVIDSLKPGGRCGIVLDEGVLFRTNETAFVQTKRKLLDDCDLWCIVSLPGGVFTAAGAGVKTNLLFFTKGKPTEKIWYYDLSDIKVGKKTPAHAGALRGVLPPAARPRRQRTQLDGDPRRDRGQELRPEGRQPQPQERRGHPHARGTAGTHRSQRARGRRRPGCAAQVVFERRREPWRVPRAGTAAGLPLPQRLLSTLVPVLGKG